MHGYLIRARVRGANGQLSSIKHTIFKGRLYDFMYARLFIDTQQKSLDLLHKTGFLRFTLSIRMTPALCFFLFGDCIV